MQRLRILSQAVVAHTLILGKRLGVGVDYDERIALRSSQVLAVRRTSGTRDELVCPRTPSFQLPLPFNTLVFMSTMHGTLLQLKSEGHDAHRFHAVRNDERPTSIAAARNGTRAHALYHKG